MPQQTSPFLEAKYGWNYGESGWNSGVDENQLKFSFLFDGGVDGVVASLPAAANGRAYFLTTDSRFYFAIGNTFYSSPCPKDFIFKIKSTGNFYQFNGTSAVQIDNPSQLDARLDAVELTVSTLGSAAFLDANTLATQGDLDVVSAQANSYTDSKVAIVQGEVDGIQTLLSSENTVDSITTEGRAFSPSQMRSRGRRVMSKSLTSGLYDHFGIMDALPDGTPYLMFRRGTTHQNDIGSLLFVKQDPSGAWGTPVTIVNANNFTGPDAGLDIAGVAGGTTDQGRIICVGFKRFPISVEPAFPNRDMVVYISDDYGVTWVQTTTITVTGGDNYKIPYGKLRILDDGKLIVPYYTRNPQNGFIAVRALESVDDGVTWTEGFTVVDSAIDYNETEILPLGGGNILAVSRIGSGAGGLLRQFLSTNNGTSWVDQGNVTPQIGDSTDVLVSPTLEYYVNESGTDFVILLYTDRTAQQLYYRTIPVTTALAGNAGWSNKRGLYSAPNESGYQSTVKVNGKILGNVFRSTTTDVVTGAYQFELRVGNMPDYDSDYFAVAANTTYTKAHGLTAFPSKIVVEWSSTIGGTAAIVNQTSINVSGTPTPSGAVVTADTTNIVVYTGTYTFSGTGWGFTGNQVGGYYRIRAWR